MIDVNIKGVLYGIAAVLPTMRQQKSGHVINLSSVAGHKVFPAAAVYCATQYAVRAISEGLRLESNGEIHSNNVNGYFRDKTLPKYTLVSYRTGGGYFWSGPKLNSLTSTKISRPAPKIPLEKRYP